MQRSVSAFVNALTLFALLLGRGVLGQGPTFQWEPRASMPTARGYIGAAELRGKIYVLGGVSSDVPQQFRNEVSTVEVYDPARDSWERLPDMRVPRVGAAVAAIDGKVYVFGGFNRRTWSANQSVEVYDIESGTWSDAAPMPTPRSWMRAVHLDGLIYVIGGVGYGYRRDVEVYNPATNSWSARTSLPGRERYLHAAVAAGGKIYVIGGDSWERGYNEVWADVWEYDPSLDRWTEKASLPTPQNGVDAVAVGNKIYVLGDIPVLRVYDVALDRWVEVPSNHTLPFLGGALVAYGGYLYRFGGGGWGPTLAIAERVSVRSSPETSPTPTSFPTSRFGLTATPLQPTPISMPTKTALAVLSRSSSDCIQQRLNLEAQVEGALTASDCWSPTFGQGFRADLYVLSVAANQRISLDIKANFRMRLYLRDPNGQVVWVKDPGPFERGDFFRLPDNEGFYTFTQTGNYVLEVTADDAGAVGSYTIRTAVPGGGCAAPVALGLQETVQGNLEFTDCWSPQKGLGYRADLYVLSVAANQRISLDISANFRMRVYLRDPNGQVVWVKDPGLFDRSDFFRLPDNEGFYTFTQTGNYVFEVTADDHNYQGVSGSYTIRTAVPGGGCAAPVALGLQETVQGNLEFTDCWSPQKGLGYRADLYVLSVAANQRISLDISANFRMRVYLRDPNGQVVWVKDPGLFDRSDFFRLPDNEGFYTFTQTGNYVFEVTADDYNYQGVRGSYTIRTAVPGGGCAAPAALGLQETVQGNLEFTDCWSPQKGLGYRSERYVLQLGEGQRVAFRLATAFGPDLRVVDPLNRIFVRLSNPEAGTFRSPVTGYYTITLPGVYLVDVTAWYYDESGGTGAYVLDVQTDAPPPPRTTPIHTVTPTPTQTETQTRSSTRTATPTITPPSSFPPPTLVAPAAEAAGLSVVPTFRWHTVRGATKYWLTVATSADALPSDPSVTTCQQCVISCSVAATQHTAGTANDCNPGRSLRLQYGRTYYWQVQAYDPVRNIHGQYSEVRRFSTWNVLPAPSLLEPTVGASNVSITPTLRWSAVSGANRYWVLVATEPDAFPTDVNATSCPRCVAAGYTDQTSLSWLEGFPRGASNGPNLPAPLRPSTTYYWRVQAFEKAAVNRMGAYSATGSFTTRAPQPEDPPPPPPPPSPTGKRPVIFIPGIKGTEIWEGSTKLWFSTDNCHVTRLRPGDNGAPRDGQAAGYVLQEACTLRLCTDVYRGFLNFLFDEGFLVPFPYDWRLDIRTAASELATAVANVLKSRGWDRVDIVAHSMGGLVAKAFLAQNQANESKVRRLILIGTPHYGAAKAILGLTEGVADLPWFFPEKVAVRAYAARNMAAAYQLLPTARLIENLQRPALSVCTRLDHVSGCAPEAFSLSNTYGETKENLLRGQWTHEKCSVCPRGWPDECGQQREQLNPRLMQSADLQSWWGAWAPRDSGLQAFLLYGSQVSTVQNLTVYIPDDGRSPGWVLPLLVRYGSGDGTVMEESARAEGMPNFYRFPFRAEHLGLVKNDEVRRCVVGLLQPTPDTSACTRAGLGRAAAPRRAVEVVLSSEKARLLVRDASGNVTGFVPGDERDVGVHVEIPDSSFDPFSTGQLALFPPQSVTIEVNASEATSARLRIRVLEERGEVYATIQQIDYEFELGAGGKAVLELSEEAFAEVRARKDGRARAVSQPTLQIDGDGDGTVEGTAEATERPVANAGISQTVRAGERVRLDGSRSLDALGRTLTYQWVQTAGPPVELSDPTNPTPEFVAPSVAEDTGLSFSLQVSANGVLSEADAVSVLVRVCGEERCNGVDDDCDGEVDEGNPEGGAACETNLPGKCATGTMQCVNGRVQCEPELECERTGCQSDADCDDGIFCNGAERCLEGLVCSPGEAPCTGVCERCDEEADFCVPIEGCTPVTPSEESPTPTDLITPTPTSTHTQTPTPSPSATVSVTPSLTPSLTASATPTLTASPSATSSPTHTASPSGTRTATPTETPTWTATPTCAPTGTPYCSDHCEPCPEIRTGCFAVPCGACTQNPRCAPGEVCAPRGGSASGCCSCATVTPTPPRCQGDCNGDRQVTIEELVTMVNVALELAPVSACTAGDTNLDGGITVEEIIRAVNMALDGCSASPDLPEPTATAAVSSCPQTNLGNVLPVTVTGSTTGLSDTVGGALCGTRGDYAPDAAYQWTAPSAGTYVIHTHGSSFDTMLYVREESCNGVELTCNDDAGGSVQSEVAVTLAAGQTIVVVVDGYGTASGNYVLTILRADRLSPTSPSARRKLQTATGGPHKSHCNTITATRRTGGDHNARSENPFTPPGHPRC